MWARSGLLPPHQDLPRGATLNENYVLHSMCATWHVSCSSEAPLQYIVATAFPNVKISTYAVLVSCVSAPHAGCGCGLLGSAD